MATHQNDQVSFHPQVQIMRLSTDDIIIETDNNLFNWQKSTSIFDAHPFFELLKVFKDLNQDQEIINFPCIHLEDDTNSKICDVTFTIK